MKEKTLKEKRIRTLKDDLTESEEGLYFGEDVKQFIKEILEKIGFLMDSNVSRWNNALKRCSEIIKQKSGFEL